MTSTPIQPYGAAPATPRMEDMAPGGQDDYVYNRLLKERIIWLGSEVRDTNANLMLSPRSSSTPRSPTPRVPR